MSYYVEIARAQTILNDTRNSCKIPSAGCKTDSLGVCRPIRYKYHIYFLIQSSLLLANSTLLLNLKISFFDSRYNSRT